MKHSLSSTVIAGICVASALVGCGPKHEKPTQSGSILQTVRVRAQKVETKSRTMTEEVVSTVRAKLRATMEAKLNGRIEQMPMVLGDKVQKGQLIAQLDAPEIAARLQQAQASLEQADREWKRVSSLYEQKSATRSEYDAAEARQRVAQGAVSEAKAMMAYTQIVAPFDAVITRKWVDVGDLAAPGKPLVDLEDPTLLQLDADVPEAVATNIQRNTKLAVRIDTLNADIVGVVSEIAPASDPVSHTLRVKLDLPQTAGLRTGQFARLSVPIGQRDSIRVPVSAVVQRGQLEIVFAVSNRQAQLHLVKTGKRVGDEVEILSGLNAGDAAVVSGAELLADGQPVEVE